jgi:hypothetical protein
LCIQKRRSDLVINELGKTSLPSGQKRARGMLLHENDQQQHPENRLVLRQRFQKLRNLQAPVP